MRDSSGANDRLYDSAGRFIITSKTTFNSLFPKAVQVKTVKVCKAEIMTIVKGWISVGGRIRLKFSGCNGQGFIGQPSNQDRLMIPIVAGSSSLKGSR